MTTINILISITIFAILLSVIMSGVAIFVFMKNRAYLKKILGYHDGLADIQARIKETILEHHTLIEQKVIDSTSEIMKHITYVNRWQKVMAKMIRVGGIHPLETAMGTETIKEAEELHEIGLDIAKVAFEDKKNIEADALENTPTSEMNDPNAPTT